MSQKLKPALRVVIRAEGEQLQAYLASMDSMDRAIHVATVNRKLAEHDAVWVAFKRLAEAILVAAAAEIGFKVVNVVEQEAPEHEKAGRA